MNSDDQGQGSRRLSEVERARLARTRADAMRALEREGWKLAATLLDSVIGTDLGNGQDHLHRGIAREESGDYDGAIDDYSQVIDLGGGDPNRDAHHRRAFCRMSRGDFEDAIDDYAIALGLEPDDAVLWNNRANCLIELGESDRALADLDRALGIDPDSGWIRNNRSRALCILGRFDEAIAEATLALDLGGVPASLARFNRGWARVRSGRLEEAVADLRECLRLDEFQAQAWHHLGRALLSLGRYAEAEEACSKALDLAEGTEGWLTHAHTNRGRARLGLGSAQDALEDLDRAVTMDADNAHAWLHRAHARLHLGDVEGARRGAERAGRLFASRGDEPHRAEAGELLTRLARAKARPHRKKIRTSTKPSRSESPDASLQASTLRPLRKVPPVEPRSLRMIARLSPT